MSRPAPPRPDAGTPTTLPPQPDAGTPTTLPPRLGDAGTRGRGDADRFERVAVFGGVYANWLALEACIVDARARGAEALYCLGDLGGFGPQPARVFPLLVEHGVRVVQGNYDHSVGHGLDDCACGYTDPQDNYYARLSYEYTYRKTPERWRPWLRALPPHARVTLSAYRVLLCHGSPRRANEFVWESTASTQFLGRLAREYDADAVVASHTGLHWARALAPTESGAPRWWINAGVIGRPANDGRTCVWYTLLQAHNGTLEHEFVPLDYDYETLATEMEREQLPAEFVATIRTGWWTTCLEVLPQKERRQGRY